MQHKIKLLEERLDKGLAKLEKLRVEGKCPEKRYEFYKRGVELTLIDYAVTTCHRGDNKISYYGRKFKKLIT